MPLDNPLLRQMGAVLVKVARRIAKLTAWNWEANAYQKAQGPGDSHSVAPSAIHCSMAWM
jgi:hypothetical protein